MGWDLNAGIVGHPHQPQKAGFGYVKVRFRELKNNNPAITRKGLLVNGRGKSVTCEAVWGGLGLPSQFFFHLVRLFIRLTSI